MRKILYLFASISFLLLIPSCDVHEWPEMPASVQLHLRLNYEENMTEWEHLYDGDKVVEQGYGQTYDNGRSYGKIRYIVRTYPVSDRQRAVMDYTQEFVFTKDISEGYDHEVTLDVLPGDYKFMVWSDLVQHDGENYLYDAASYSEIKLKGSHKGNNDYRDAFRGTGSIVLETSIMYSAPDTLDIAMQRPLAKFEFVTSDLLEFIDKESSRVDSKANGGNASSSDDTPTKAIDIDDYRVRFYYVGFMPNAYSMLTDKPVDSSTGVMFESALSIISESKASVGFDYVFVNGKESAVTVQVGIYDKDGVQLSLTDPIIVPLKRSYHTIVKGMFLTSKASGGVVINPDFQGDHNLIFP